MSGETDTEGKLVRVAVVGSINMDLVVRSQNLPRPGETVMGRESAEIPGGKGANQAVAAARLGAAVSMIGRVGQDAFGARLRGALESAGIDVTHVTATEDCASGLAVVAVEDSGENAITVVPGANGRLGPDDVLRAEQAIRTADVLLVQLEVPLPVVAAAVSLARRHQVLTVLDPAPAPESFPHELFPIDVVCPNEPEMGAMIGATIRTQREAEQGAVELQKRGATYAIVTRGSQGAILCGGDGTCHSIPSVRVRAVDTTAAGDAFAAALGVRLAAGHDVVDAVRFACAAGAVAASRFGAQPAMPTRADVLRLLSSTRPVAERGNG